MLISEQLNIFYDLQPEISTIQDMSAEIVGIEVIENEQPLTDAAEQTFEPTS